MTRMYVANPTAQDHGFMYRVAESTNVIEHTIPRGGQVMLRARGGNLSMADVEAIVSHHGLYGMIPVGDVGGSPEKVGLIYSLDKPVPFTKLHEQIMRNARVMTDVGKKARQAAAVAANDRINDQLSQLTNMNVMQQLTVEIEEKTRARVLGEDYYNADLARSLAESPAIAEGIRVDEHAPPQTAKKPRARRRRPI